ncbi:MAG: hypothetical protein ACR2M9_05090 [Cyanophyceae cyanobacterium]
MPYSKSPMKKSSCIKMYDGKGKPSGLMMEGSAVHMSMLHKEKTKKLEKAEAKKLDKKQEIKEISSKASPMEMSPYKLTDKEKSITEGIELGEATASLSDMYKRDAALTVPDFPKLTEDTSGRIFVKGQPTGSHPYIGRGSFEKGSVGSVYTPEQISEGRKQHEALKAKKQKAKSWLASNA